MNLAKLTGRIPILPEVVWARACAVERCDSFPPGGDRVFGEILTVLVWEDSEVCNQNSLRHFEHRNSHEEELGASESLGVFRFALSAHEAELERITASEWNEDGEIWELGIEVRFLGL